MIVLHWDKMQRPDRAAWLGAISALQLLLAIVNPYTASFIMRELQPTQVVEQKRVHFVLVSPGSSGKECVCRPRARFNLPSGKIWETGWKNERLPTCDAAFTYPRKWTRADTLSNFHIVRAGSSSGKTVDYGFGILDYSNGSGLYCEELGHCWWIAVGIRPQDDFRWECKGGGKQ